MLALAMVLLIFSLQRESPAIEILNFNFYDTTQHAYRSTHVMEDLIMHRETGADPLVLLIETPTLGHRYYLRQTHLLPSFISPEHEVLSVIACPTGMDPKGYHTDMDTARFLGGGRNAFRVLLLDGEGMILKIWKKPVSAGELTSFLNHPPLPMDVSDHAAILGVQQRASDRSSPMAHLHGSTRTGIP